MTSNKKNKEEKTVFSLFSNSGKRAYFTHEYIVDTPSDIAQLPTDVNPGSKAFVISNSTYYMMNHQKQWIKVNLGSSSSSDPTVEEIVYDGGGV